MSKFVLVILAVVLATALGFPAVPEQETPLMRMVREALPEPAHHRGRPYGFGGHRGYGGGFSQSSAQSSSFSSPFGSASFSSAKAGSSAFGR